MPLIQFKLTSSAGVTRLAIFNEAPTWDALAAKLHSLFGIPIESVGVSYVDNECDEITLSSQEELEDYYAYADKPDLIKFAVVDLLSPRDSILKTTTDHSEFDQDTFGNDNFELLDPDWQSLPKVSSSDITLQDNDEDRTNPFAQVVSSDVSGFDARNHVISESGDDVDTFKSLDKGKAKATEEAPDHVPGGPLYDLDAPSVVGIASDFSSEPLSESTPKAKATAVDATHSSLPTESAREDPPLPPLDEHPASATLSDDITALINAFTQAVRGHPELSEGVSKILRNITTGTYWQDHRERLSKAARDLQDDSNQPDVDADASKRLVDSIDQMLRSFSVGGAASAATNATDADSEEVKEAEEDQTSSPPKVAEPSEPTTPDDHDAKPPTESPHLQSNPWSNQWHSGFHGNRTGHSHWTPSVHHPPLPHIWPHFPPPPP
ncbi:hypothetical protein BJ165DRAFT_1430833, partial [Panaeolus papilionaceus]